MALSEMLTCNHSLKKIDVSFNPIRCQGLGSIQRGLDQNFSIVEFDFNVTPFQFNIPDLIEKQNIMHRIHQIKEKNQMRLKSVFHHLQNFYSLWKNNPRICRVLYFQ